MDRLTRQTCPTRHGLLAAALPAAAFAASLLATPSAQAWSYRQPWVLQLDSHESRVWSCTNPTPLNRVAMDDWVADEEARVKFVVWWGVLTSGQAQENPGAFRIAIANDTDCVPGDTIFQRCVRPRYRYVGTDCLGQPVYRFFARLPGGGFHQQQGGHYWLSIAELDDESATQGEDFRWSGHRTPKFCRALQIQAGGGLIQPLISACDGQINDLAFALFGRAIQGQVDAPLRSSSAILEIHTLEGDLVESLSVDIAPDGSFFAVPGARDGDYEAVLRMPGALDATQSLTLEEGTVATVEWADVPFGDLSGDGLIDLRDLLIVLRYWSP